MPATEGGGFRTPHVAQAAPPTPGDPENPTRFDYDYQERTGFPLNHEDRFLSFGAIDAQMNEALSGEAKNDWRIFLEDIISAAPRGREGVRMVRAYSDKPVYIIDGYAILPDPTSPEKSDLDFIEQLNVRAFCESAVANLSSDRCVSLHRDHPQNRGVIAILLASRTIIIRGESKTGGLSLVTLAENLVSERSRARGVQIDLSARQDQAPTVGVNQNYAVYPGAENAEYIQLDTQGAPWAFPAYPDLQWQYDRARFDAPDYDWTGRDPCLSEKAQDKEQCLRAREPRGLAGLPGGSWLALAYRIGALSARSLGQPGGDGGRGLDIHEPIQCGLTSSYGFSCELKPSCFANPPPDGYCPDSAPGQQPYPGGDNICVCQGSGGTTFCSPPTCAAAYSPKHTNLSAANPPPPELSSGECPTVACKMTQLSPGPQGGQAGIGGPPGHFFVHTVSRASRCDVSFFTPSKLADPQNADALDRECIDGDSEDCSEALCKNNKDVQVCPASAPPSSWNVNIENFLELWKLLVGKDPVDLDIASLPLDLLNPSAGSNQLIQVDGGYLRLEEAKPKKGKKAEKFPLPEVTFLMAPPWAPSTVELPRSLWASETEQITGSEEPPALPSEIAVNIPTSRMPRCRCTGNGCAGVCKPLSKKFMERYQQLLEQSVIAQAARHLRSAAIARGVSVDVPVSLSVLLPFSDKPKNYSPIAFVLQIDQYALLLDLKDVFVSNIDTGGLDILCNEKLPVSFVAHAGASGQPGAPGLGAPNKKCPSWQPQDKNICYRPISAGCPGGGVQPWPRPDHPEDSIYSCQLNCAQDIRYPERGIDPPKCPTGYTLGQLSDLPWAATAGGKQVLCPERVGNQTEAVECSAPAGKWGTFVSQNTKPNVAKLTSWTRSGWAIATEKLHPLEMRRRVGQGNTHFKRNELLDAKTRYLSTRAHLNEIESKSSPGCSLNNIEACSVCKNGPDKAPLAWKNICALGTEIDLRAGRLFLDENYYGYERNFVPPTALRTFGDGTTVNLADIVRNELQFAKEDMTLWLDLGGSLGREFAQNTNALNSLELQRASLAQTYTVGGSLSLEVQGADGKILDVITGIKNVRDQIAALNLEQKKIQLSASGGLLSSDISLKVVEVGKIALMAAATGAGGPLAAWAASYAWENAKSDSAKSINESIIKSSGNENAKKWLESKKLQAKCPTCPPNPNDSRVSWSGVTSELFSSATAKKAYEAFSASPSQLENNLKLAILDVTVRQFSLQAVNLGRELTEAIHERRVLAQKIQEAQLQVARIDAATQALQQALGPSSLNKHPSAEIQAQIVDAALNRAAARVDRAGEYFFLLRRGVERETIPADPITGLSKLSAYEDQQLLNLQECFDADVKSPSIHITFKGLSCFESRTEKLRQYAQLYWGTDGTEEVYFLDPVDTTVPINKPASSTSPHTWETDSTSGDHTIQFNIDLAIAHRSIRATHRSQKLDNISFFLETDSSTPEVIPIQVSRGSLDDYWIGTRPAEDGGEQNVFQSFDVAKGAGSSTLGLLELVRKTESYLYDGSACNGKNEGDALEGIFAACSLKGEKPAFLARQSLLGTISVKLTKQALANKSPKSIKAFITYRYAK